MAGLSGKSGQPQEANGWMYVKLPGPPDKDSFSFSLHLDFYAFHRQRSLRSPNTSEVGAGGVGACPGPVLLNCPGVSSTGLKQTC